MVSYLILCRSLTYAQRTARILARTGISSYIMRTPHSIAAEGCGYCVRLREQYLANALVVLRREGMTPKQIYVQRDDGNYSEVAL